MPKIFLEMNSPDKINTFCTKNEEKSLKTVNYNYTGDKSGAEAPGPSGFPISFNEFTNVFISAFIK